MKNTYRKLPITGISLILIFLMAFGCTPARRPIPNGYGEDQYNRGITTDRERIMDIGSGDQDLSMGGITPNNDPALRNYAGNPSEQTTQEALRREIQDLEGVGDVVAIYSDRIAYVGIAPEEGRIINNMRGLQTEIASKIRNRMPGIERIYVTTDQDRVSRLRGYADKLDGKKPDREMINEIEELF
ncbi:YhcN/YlaJ family sporulation lipoprotein [Anaerosolibacter carboniphilus]|uniref:YhcN/YlaJ family sporulation lipoprotein n=1 Tax=Anaerosolibacter carboniphilus TaxID=1417629 RepID=A0A841KSQ5_9FIRM|nr:YhcN/YlaJ family sporulation lipoprotein [Anaerosolibacter carboniphilus]